MIYFFEWVGENSGTQELIVHSARTSYGLQEFCSKFTRLRILRLLHERQCMYIDSCLFPLLRLSIGKSIAILERPFCWRTTLKRLVALLKRHRDVPLNLFLGAEPLPSPFTSRCR